MSDLVGRMADALHLLQNHKNGDHQALLAKYEAALTGVHRQGLEIARLKKPGASLLARLGLGDLAWVQHLNRDYKDLREFLPTLNALTPEPKAEAVKNRPAWPEGFDPETKKRSTLLNPFTWGSLAVAVKNKLAFPSVQAPDIFEAIQDAGNWEENYANGGKASVKKLEQLGQAFSFRTFNTTFKSKLVIYQEKGEVLSIGWHAKSLSTEIVHRWDIYSDGKGGSIVTTEETQRGFKPALTSARLKPAMEITHQNWLYGQAVAAIKKRNAKAPPRVLSD